MLGRRKPRSPLDLALAWVWPRRGPGRAGRYVVKRIARIKGSPHAIAAGLASGAAVSFLPLPGLHFVLGGLLAFAARGSIIASAVGTIVGNPWTFPFIWIAGYRIGAWLGFGGGGEVHEARLGARVGAVFDEIWRGNFSMAAVDSWPVLAPMLVGGALMALVVWILVYGLGRYGIAAYQTRRQQRLAAKRAAWSRPSSAVHVGEPQA